MREGRKIDGDEGKGQMGKQERKGWRKTAEVLREKRGYEKEGKEKRNTNKQWWMMRWEEGGTEERLEEREVGVDQWRGGGRGNCDQRMERREGRRKTGHLTERRDKTSIVLEDGAGPAGFRKISVRQQIIHPPSTSVQSLCWLPGNLPVATRLSKWAHFPNSN